MSFVTFIALGAPLMLNENLNSTRSLVNGTAALMHSLHFGPDGPPSNYTAAMDEARYQEVIVEKAPLAMMVRVGNSPGQDYRWHGLKLPNLAGKLIALNSTNSDGDGNDFDDVDMEDAGCDSDADVGASDDNDKGDGTPGELGGDELVDQLVPVIVAKDTREIELTGSAAARHAVPKVLEGKMFPINIAFALTDYKLQGRSLRYLLINLAKRTKFPYMTLKSFYVLISRVTTGGGLRTLEADEDALEKLLMLKHDDKLVAWTLAYDGDGYWSDTLARAAMADIARENTQNREPKGGHRKSEEDTPPPTEEPDESLSTPTPLRQRGCKRPIDVQTNEDEPDDSVRAPLRLRRKRANMTPPAETEQPASTTQ
jgi:hypothetical protein